MKSILLQSGEFTYTAELRALAHPAGHYGLTFQSTWGDAKAPTANRTLFQVTTDAAGLVALRDLIDQAVLPATT